MFKSVGYDLYQFIGDEDAFNEFLSRYSIDVYDITYVDNFNFWLDICILFKTVATVFKREGIEFVKNDSINKREEKE